MCPLLIKKISRQFMSNANAGWSSGVLCSLSSFSTDNDTKLEDPHDGLEQGQQTKTTTLYPVEMGLNLFQFCANFYKSENEWPESSLCKHQSNAYVLYYNLSEVSISTGWYSKFDHFEFSCQIYKIVRLNY